MGSQHFADLLNGFRQRATEFLISKMDAHPIHNPLPELFAAFLVNRFVTNDGELMRSRGYENQHGVALASFVHPESLKFFLRNDHRIDTQLATLNKNANLPGRF